MADKETRMPEGYKNTPENVTRRSVARVMTQLGVEAAMQRRGTHQPVTTESVKGKLGPSFGSVAGIAARQEGNAHAYDGSVRDAAIAQIKEEVNRRLKNLQPQSAGQPVLSARTLWAVQAERHRAERLAAEERALRFELMTDHDTAELPAQPAGAVALSGCEGLEGPACDMFRTNGFDPGISIAITQAPRARQPEPAA